MVYLKRALSCLIVVFFLGCNALENPVKETREGYEIMASTELTVILKTPLSSNKNQRGDLFTTTLKKPFFKKKTILPEGTQIRGLVKRATKFEKIGDRANLLLLFDQVLLPDGKKIPLAASLDTDEGSKVIKIEGKAVRDTTIIGGSALVGSLVGRSKAEEGTSRGLVVGAVAGTGAVLLSNAMEVNLPIGTELVIKLDEPLVIPK